MKALSIKYPWVTLIAQGKKNIEIRTWQTQYRGPLLICASKKPTFDYAGYAICIVDLIDIRLNRKCYHWILDNVRLIENPFPVKGQLMLFEIDLLPPFD